VNEEEAKNARTAQIKFANLFLIFLMLSSYMILLTHDLLRNTKLLKIRFCSL
jgi:hypothetical protein